MTDKKRDEEKDEDFGFEGDDQDGVDEDEEFDDDEDEIPRIESERASAFKKTMTQVKTFHKEISVISNKKPDSPINKFKLGFINETLEKANFVLGGEFLPFPSFRTFDEASMPSASDAVLVLSHYIDGLCALRDKYFVNGHWIVTSDEDIVE